jgi:hypothetical protein
MGNELESTLSQARLLVEQYRDANPVSKVLLGMGKRFDAIVAILSRPLGQGPPVGWLTKFTDPSDIHLLSRPRHTIQVRLPGAAGGAAGSWPTAAAGGAAARREPAPLRRRGPARK